MDLNDSIGLDDLPLKAKIDLFAICLEGGLEAVKPSREFATEPEPDWPTRIRAAEIGWELLDLKPSAEMLEKAWEVICICPELTEPRQ